MEVKALGISVLRPCINNSGCGYEVTADGIYYPLSGIRNIGSIAKIIITVFFIPSSLHLYFFILQVDSKN